MTDIRDAIKEFNSTAGIGGVITQIYNACNSFMENPSDKTLANVLMVSFQNMTQVLHELDSKLTAATQQQKFDLELGVKDFNQYAQRLAELNEAIRNDVSANGGSEYFGPNELLDERNLILDELAKYGDVETEAKRDGTVTLRMNGHTVVAGSAADILNYSAGNDQTVSLSWNSTGREVSFTKGKFKAYTDFINGAGPNAALSSESGQKGIRYYRSRLDTFAGSLAAVYNKIIPAMVDPDTNEPLGSDCKILMGARVERVNPDGTISYETTADVPVTAANIAVSDQWLADSGYIMHRQDDTSVKYVAQLMYPLKDGEITFQSRGESFTGSFEEYVNDYTNTISTDISYYTGRQSATAEIANQMLDRRDSVSGVAQDDETVTMMTYSKAYQAVSRVMTALDEALDVLINRTGTVGR